MSSDFAVVDTQSQSANAAVSAASWNGEKLLVKNVSFANQYGE